MDGALQARIKPHIAPQAIDYSDAKVVPPQASVTDGEGGDKVSFRDLLMNSNTEVERSRVAQKNGNGLAGAKTDDEFRKMLSDRANKDLLRKPQNDLDKDAFLKLFVTQMQNQDPLNPDDSSEMAAQLAQFNGLEQMLNVNKNLEKMQGEQALSRNVSLINFVGKEVKLDGGKLKLEGGKLTDATFNLEKDAPRSTLEIRDASGVVVGARDLGQMKAGEHQVEWDGIGTDGRKVGDGVYTFSVVAKDLNDQSIPVKIASSVKVTGVDLKDDSGSFYTDLGKVRINEIASIGDTDFVKKARAAEAVKTETKVSDGKEAPSIDAPVPVSIDAVPDAAGPDGADQKAGESL